MCWMAAGLQALYLGGQPVHILWPHPSAHSRLAPAAPRGLLALGASVQTGRPATGGTWP